MESLRSISLLKKIEYIPSTFIIRPARNALKLVRGKFNNLIHNSMMSLTQCAMHGRRVFAFLEFLFRSDRPFFWPAAGLKPESASGGTPET
jgi:hypothetical protein